MDSFVNNKESDTDHTLEKALLRLCNTLNKLVLMCPLVQKWQGIQQKSLLQAWYLLKQPCV